MDDEKYHDLTPAELARALEHAGESPDPDLIRAIVARRAEMEPLLLAMFADAFADEWEEEDDPRWYRLEHSGNILIGWQSAAAAPLFGDLYLSEPLQDALELFEADPWFIGPPAVPAFIRVMATPTGKAWHYGRALAGTILRNIALVYPETRETIVAALRAQLPPLDAIPALTEKDYDEMWSPFITELADLQDTAGEAQVMAMFDADLVDTSFIDRQEYQVRLRGEESPLWPEPVDVVAHYETMHEVEEEKLRQLEAERERRAQELRKELDFRAMMRDGPKVGRNEPCPCGSGKKYKQCHGKPGGVTSDE